MVWPRTYFPPRTGHLHAVLTICGTHNCEQATPRYSSIYNEPGTNKNHQEIFTLSLSEIYLPVLAIHLAIDNS